MRFSTSVPHKDRDDLILSDFRGVDLSSPPPAVSKKRASFLRNLICEYGVNRKRPGWKELFRLSDASGSPLPVNGIFEYRFQDRHEFIVHAGSRFFSVSDSFSVSDITASCSYSPASVDPARIESARSQSFFSGGRLFIIGCGDYLVYGSWDGGSSYQLRRVFDNEDTFIPVTTISIDDDSVSDPVRATLDPLNLLTFKRKNRCLGRYAASNASVSWTLDAPVDEGSQIIIEVEKSDGGSLVIKNAPSESSGFVSDLYIYEVDDIPVDKPVSIVNGVPNTVGNIDFSTGRFTLTGIDTSPPVSGRDNITVTFSHSPDQPEDIISSCRFGSFFGVGGLSDRLFLSGNPSHPNTDYFSESDDLTYFPDISYSNLGTDRFPITAYSRLSDGTMAVFKDSDGSEPGIFYRTGQFLNSYDDSGNLIAMDAAFPVTAGNVSERVISRFACAGFFGDPLILSENGVFGIVLAQNVSTTERYVRERSRNINAHLIKNDLSDAVATVYKGRYYLAVSDSLYIADSRFKFTGDDPDGSYNYEWWYWDGIPARVLSCIGDALWFGCPDGRVCSFYDGFSDITFDIIPEGNITFDVSSGTVTYNSTALPFLSEGDCFSFDTDGIFASVFTEYSCSNGRFFVSDVSRIFEGTVLYFDFPDHPSSEREYAGKPLLVTDIDRGDCSFRLTYSSGTALSPLPLNGRFSRLISSLPLTVTSLSDGSFRLSDSAGDPVSFVDYAGSVPDRISGRLIHRKNVVAEWYSPAFDMGSHNCAKTLFSLSVAAESGIGSSLSFGYDTRLSGSLSPVRGLGGFSLESLSFEDFTFGTGFQTSYTVRCYERNFNYIMFRFLSDSPSDCAFYSLTACYKLNRPVRGVL